MSVLTAAYNVAHDYKPGAGALGELIGKNATTFNHELNRTGSAKLGLLDAVKMTDMTGDERILASWAMHRNKMLVPLPDGLEPGGDCTMNGLAEFANEFAATTAHVCQSKADNKVTDNELREYFQRFGRMVVMGMALGAMLTAENAALRPSNVQAGA
jgi:hypothetical protein